MKHINVEIINAELANCNTTIANLKILFTENADQLKQIIIVLGKHNSTLDDQIEEIKAENENLRVRHQLIEEEKRMAVEAMKTELELLYLET
jgi:predicted ribosome quality control (RQC) complex YloA/Tae2 family protein